MRSRDADRVSASPGWKEALGEMEAVSTVEQTGSKSSGLRVFPKIRFQDREERRVTLCT